MPEAVPVQPGSTAVSLEGARSVRVANAATKGDLITLTAAGGAVTQSADRIVAAPPEVSAEMVVSVLSTAAATSAHLDWLAFAVDGVRLQNTSAARVSIDYTSFRYAFGGDWAERLQVVRLAQCGNRVADCTATPQSVRLISNDVVNGILTVELPLTSGGSAGFGASAARRALLGGPDLFGLSSGVGGSAGDWGATSLGRSGKWAQTGADGGFSWSYPIPTPEPIAGVGPALSVGYSSSSLDAYTNDANNQGSWVGAGWDLSTGFIERSYIGCANDGGIASNGNLCWFTDSAGVREHLSLSLNGSSSRLVAISTNEWRLEDDTGWRVQRLYGGECIGGTPTGVVSGKGGPLVDNDNEYFVVTTPDGVRYRFG